MTIPFNSTERSMKEYLIAELDQSDFYLKNKCYWYQDGNKNNCKINT